MKGLGCFRQTAAPFGPRACVHVLCLAAWRLVAGGLNCESSVCLVSQLPFMKNNKKIEQKKIIFVICSSVWWVVLFGKWAMWRFLFWFLLVSFERLGVRKELLYTIIFLFYFSPHFFSLLSIPPQQKQKKACEFLFVCKLIFFPAARLLGAFSCSLLLGGGRSWEKGLFSKFSIFLFFLFFFLVVLFGLFNFFLLFLLPVGFRWREGGRQRKKRNKKRENVDCFFPSPWRPSGVWAGGVQKRAPNGSRITFLVMVCAYSWHRSKKTTKKGRESETQIFHFLQFRLGIIIAVVCGHLAEPTAGRRCRRSSRALGGRFSITVVVAAAAGAVWAFRRQ